MESGDAIASVTGTLCNRVSRSSVTHGSGLDPHAGMREAFKKPIPERGCKSLNLQLRFSVAATFEKHFLKEQNFRELLLQIRRKLDLRSRLHGDLP